MLVSETQKRFPNDYFPKENYLPYRFSSCYFLLCAFFCDSRSDIGANPSFFHKHFVVVLAASGWEIAHIAAMLQKMAYRLCGKLSGSIMIQSKVDLLNFRMFMQILTKSKGQ